MEFGKIIIKSFESKVNAKSEFRDVQFIRRSSFQNIDIV